MSIQVYGNDSRENVTSVTLALEGKNQPDSTWPEKRFALMSEP